MISISKSFSSILILILIFRCSGDKDDVTPSVLVPTQTSPPRVTSTSIKNALFAVTGVDSKKLYALNVETGEQLWYTDVPKYTEGITLAGDKIFTKTNSPLPNILQALDGNTGAMKWKFPFENESTNLIPYVSPDNSTVYLLTNSVSSSGGKVYAIRAQDGTLKWSQDEEVEIGSSIQEQNGLVIYSTTDGKLICADASNGIRKWDYDFKDDSYSFNGPVVYKGYVVVGYLNAYYAFQVSDGKLLWKFGNEDSYIVTDPIFNDNFLFVILRNKTNIENSTLYCLNLINGDIKWTYLLPDKDRYADYNTPCISSDRVYCLSGSGYFSVLNTSGQRLWERKSNLVASIDPLVINNTIYTSGYDTKDVGIFAFDALTGNQKWKRIIDQFRYPYVSVAFDGKIYNSILVGN